MANWGSCDFKELQQLRENIEKMDKGRRQFCEDCARELAARLLALVIPRTPVGKMVREADGTVAKYDKEKHKGQKLKTVRAGGTLRRGWTAKTEAEAEKRGNGMTAQAYAQSLPVTQSGGNYQVTVINPVNYASYVEFGHRQTPGRYVPAIGKKLKQGWVKGQYMLTLSEKQLAQIAPAVLEKKLEAFLSGVFHG